MAKVNLLFGIHCHQPSGNFDFVFRKLADKSYLPFLRCLASHPGVKITVHFSGCLLEWLDQNCPEVIGLLQSLSARGQIEILGGGYFEPILASIPESDRYDQIMLLSRYIENKFGIRPRGMWLAERVWDSSVVKSIVESGIEYVLVDDYPFLSIGKSEADLKGYYLTDEENLPLAVFPIDARLRYLTPFQPIGKTIDFLKDLAVREQDACAIVVDDGEKYGGWPGTYEWVYENKWLEDFLSEIEANSSWINCLTMREALDAFPPRGHVYLPTSAYFEMGQWSLPSESAVEFGQAWERMSSDSELARYKKFLRGGIWKNFLIKYPESNRMHKKMFYIHYRLKALPESELASKAKLHLMRAQTNDAYWHGVFGGLYLPHLRHAVYQNLLLAEQMLTEPGTFNYEYVDFDHDGNGEFLIFTPEMSFAIAPAQGGQIIEWSHRNLAYNLANTIARRPEHYHVGSAEKANVAEDVNPSDSVATIHEREGKIDPLLKNKLFYDSYARNTCIDHFISSALSLDDFSKSNFTNYGDFVNNEYSIRNIEKGNPIDLTLVKIGSVHSDVNDKIVQIMLEKNFIFHQSGFDVYYTLRNLSDITIQTRFGVEFNLAMPAGGGVAGRYYIDQDLAADASFNSLAETKAAAHIRLEDDVFGGSVAIQLDTPQTWWRFPLQTVSQSEAGWEMTYQSSMLMPIWDLHMEANAEYSIHIRAIVETGSPAI